MKRHRSLTITTTTTAALLLAVGLSACGAPSEVPGNAAVMDFGGVKTAAEVNNGTAGTLDAVTDAASLTGQAASDTLQETLSAQAVPGGSAAAAPEADAPALPASPADVPEDVFSARLDMDYTGELFPGSGITAGQIEQALASCGSNISVFTIDQGACEGQSYVYLVGDASLGIPSGVWGDGTQDTAEAYLEALFRYCSGQGTQPAGTQSAQQAQQAQPSQGSAQDVSQDEVDEKCSEGGGDAVVFQDGGTWYLATASWAGGGIREISESDAQAYTQTGIMPSGKPSPAQSGEPSTDAPQGMLALVNADREANGIGALSWSDDLAQVALARVQEVKANYDAGADPHAGAGNYDILGENAAAGQDGTAAANAAWIGSPSHHGNRLQGSDTEYACAYLHVPGSAYGWYWVEVFR